MADVTPTFATDSKAVLKPQVTTSAGGEEAARRSGRRRTKHSKVIGDRAEAIVHASLQKDGLNGLRWLANEGEKPGWDIEYIGKDGRLVAVEVKGTTGSAFTSFEMTDGKWQQAQQLRERYVLYLVSRCASKEPLITKIIDPFGRGDFEIVPVLRRIVARR